MPPASASPGTSPGSGGGVPTGVAGTPSPAGSGSGEGTPSAGSTRQASLAELERQLRDIDQQVARLLEAAGETPTPQQALEILRILAERAEIASKRDSLTGGGGPRDY